MHIRVYAERERERRKKKESKINLLKVKHQKLLKKKKRGKIIGFVTSILLFF